MQDHGGEVPPSTNLSEVLQVCQSILPSRILEQEGEQRPKLKASFGTGGVFKMVATTTRSWAHTAEDSKPAQYLPRRATPVGTTRDGAQPVFVVRCRRSGTCKPLELSRHDGNGDSDDGDGDRDGTNDNE
jgi:hypothetical protein